VVSRCPTYALAIRAPEHLTGDKTQKLNKINYYGASPPHRHQTKFHRLGNSYIIEWEIFALARLVIVH
jgi:hypothetical protein